MGVGSLLVFLFVGLVAGWLAGKVVQGGGFGLIGNIIVGVIGAFFAGWLLPRLGFSVGGGVIASIINAFIGASILLIILRIVKRA
ncbi:GlsB/YeaQ/YmgE family stress response membrane protein [Brucella melitensis]|uniref:GlsB/YeaQ/YmgE family stress response membrane protein n=1 Tax=Brucella melitensis TaxID=29459 RepID=UPI0031FBDD22